jgi:hypothetical protein
MLKNLTATYKGLITGVAMIVACIVCYFALHIPFNSKEQFVVFAIYTAGIIWCLLDFNSNNKEEYKLKAYFQEGFKVFVVVTLLMVIYSIVFYKMETGIRDAWIANNNVELLKEGNHMPPEIAENARQMKTMFLPMMVGINLFKYLIIGVLITVITGGFLISQKKN